MNTLYSDYIKGDEYNKLRKFINDRTWKKETMFNKYISYCWDEEKIYVIFISPKKYLKSIDDAEESHKNFGYMGFSSIKIYSLH